MKNHSVRVTKELQDLGYTILRRGHHGTIFSHPETDYRPEVPERIRERKIADHTIQEAKSHII